MKFHLIAETSPGKYKATELTTEELALEPYISDEDCDIAIEGEPVQLYTDNGDRACVAQDFDRALLELARMHVKHVSYEDF